MTKLSISFIVVIVSSFFLFQSVFAIEWFQNPYFNNPAVPFDTGDLFDVDTSGSPDDWKWKYACYSWDWTGHHPIDACRVQSYEAGTDDYNVHLYGVMDSSTELIGVVTLRQSNPRLSVNQDIYVDTWLSRGYSSIYPGHAIDMMDVWIIDESTGKYMVLDLMFWSTYWPTTNTFVHDGNLHYNDILPSNCYLEYRDTWYHCTFKLSDYIDRAIAEAANRGLTYNKASMKIYKAEVLVEVKRIDIGVPVNGVANLDVGTLRLYTPPDSCDDTDGLNIYRKGTVSGYNNGNSYSYTDYCSGNRLYEYWCDGTSWDVTTYNCPTGYYCSNGRCIKSSGRGRGGGSPGIVMMLYDILDPLKQPAVIIFVLGIIVVIVAILQFMAKKT